MITAAQLRAARGLLDWTRNDLAHAANISPETIKNIEHGTFRPQETTAEAIIRAFALHDVEFAENDGVCRKKNRVVTYEGEEGFKRFVDAVYQTALLPSAQAGGDKPICASNFNDDLFAHHLGDYLAFHVQRMNKIPNFNVRILAHNDSTKLQNLKSRGSTYRQCRRPMGGQAGDITPFYVFGDNLGILVFEDRRAQIIVIASAPVAKTYRHNFEMMWEHASPIAED